MVYFADHVRISGSQDSELIQSIRLLAIQRKTSLNLPKRVYDVKPLAQDSAKVWLEGYGCSASMADYEMIGGLLKNAGFQIVSKEEDASLNLIVTCSVKDATEHRMIHRIKRFTKSGKPLVIAGCLPKADREKIELINPSASLIGPHSIDKTVEVVASTLSGERQVILEDSDLDKINIPRVRMNPVVSIVEIASGCMSKCTFCQTRLAKGWLRSYRIGDIIRQVRSDIVDGCREVWLTSTDNGCYGKDIGSDLIELLESCIAINGDFKIRVGMMNPMYLPGMLDRMANLFAKSEKIFKFLHIPVQSGSDKILRMMKRGHSAKIFRDAVRELRSKMPEITISTDVIVGFPSERDSDFEKTLALLEETEPDIINSSRYSARPGTESAGWRQDANANLQLYPTISSIKQRTERLHRLIREIGKRRNARWMGWVGEVIIDEIGKVVQGRNYCYRPVVISNPNYLHSLGAKVTIAVSAYSNYSLKGMAI